MTTEEQNIVNKWNSVIEKELNMDQSGRVCAFPAHNIISVDEYMVCRKYNLELEKISCCCESGLEAYRQMLKLYRVTIGLMSYGTPIEGYYKVIGEKDNGYICYYNYRDGESFLEDEIVVHKRPFFNKRSESNVYHISVGDIISVENLSLVEDIFNGEVYKAYKVVWSVIN